PRHPRAVGLIISCSRGPDESPVPKFARIRTDVDGRRPLRVPQADHDPLVLNDELVLRVGYMRLDEEVLDRLHTTQSLDRPGGEVPGACLIHRSVSQSTALSHSRRGHANTLPTGALPPGNRKRGAGAGS